MKSFLYVVFVFAFVNGLFSQTKENLLSDIQPIEMLFPEGKTKALILSYDDGRIYDRRLVERMNHYQLVGTFHLNANKLDQTDYLTKNEIKTLFAKHEVSVHSFNHPNLTTLSAADVVVEIREDRRELERLVNYPVRGMAYPFGNNNDTVVDIVRDLGIEYARTVDDTYQFILPTNFLKWHPSIHQFSKAYWEPNKPEKDAKELALFYKTLNDFLQTKELALLDVWGHSWEMGVDEAKWAETETFFKTIAHQPSVHYTNHIDIVDYINAFRQLKFSMDKTIVFNPSASKLWFKKGNNTYSLAPGKSLLQ